MKIHRRDDHNHALGRKNLSVSQDSMVNVRRCPIDVEVTRRNGGFFLDARPIKNEDVAVECKHGLI